MYCLLTAVQPVQVNNENNASPPKKTPLPSLLSFFSSLISFHRIAFTKYLSQALTYIHIQCSTLVPLIAMPHLHERGYRLRPSVASTAPRAHFKFLSQLTPKLGHRNIRDRYRSVTGSKTDFLSIELRPPILEALH